MGQQHVWTAGSCEQFFHCTSTGKGAFLLWLFRCLELFCAVYCLQFKSLHPDLNCGTVAAWWPSGLGHVCWSEPLPSPGWWRLHPACVVVLWPAYDRPETKFLPEVPQQSRVVHSQTHPAACLPGGMYEPNKQQEKGGYCRTGCSFPHVCVKTGYISSVCSSGQSCAFLADQNVMGLISAIHELASRERQFYCWLCRVRKLILTPIRHKGNWKQDINVSSNKCLNMNVRSVSVAMCCFPQRVPLHFSATLALVSFLLSVRVFLTWASWLVDTPHLLLTSCRMLRAVTSPHCPCWHTWSTFWTFTRSMTWHAQKSLHLLTFLMC